MSQPSPAGRVARTSAAAPSACDMSRVVPACLAAVKSTRLLPSKRDPTMPGARSTFRCLASLRPCLPPKDFKQRVARQFNARAPTYDVGNSYHPPQAARLVEMAALQPGERVLDIGTGTGLVALAAARLVGSGHVTGVDLSDAMIQVAANKASEQGLHNLQLMATDIDKCDFRLGQFDCILCSNAVPFLPVIPASLAEWRSWLKHGGRLLFNAPKGVGSQAYTVFKQLAAERGLEVKDPCFLFSETAGVQHLLEIAGYSNVTIKTSVETNVRAGQTPQQWAETGWRLVMALPFADISAALGPQQLEEMRLQYLTEAGKVAAEFETSEGIAETFTMLWVAAHV